jgi:predicted nucleotidyltransferase
LEIEDGRVNIYSLRNLDGREKMIATPQNLRIELPREKIANFCQRWGIARLEIFGSALRDDFGADSDVDFLFMPGPNFQHDKAYGPWGHDNMAAELSALIGREVDLIEHADIERHRNWIRRKHILDTAQTIYVEG